MRRPQHLSLNVHYQFFHFPHQLPSQCSPGFPSFFLTTSQIFLSAVFHVPDSLTAAPAACPEGKHSLCCHRLNTSSVSPEQTREAKTQSSNRLPGEGSRCVQGAGSDCREQVCRVGSQTAPLQSTKPSLCSETPLAPSTCGTTPETERSSLLGCL